MKFRKLKLNARYYRGIVIVLLVLLNLLLLSLFLKPSQSDMGVFPEVKEVEARNLDFVGLKKYFTDLANKKGAEYAFKVLKEVKVRPGIDFHLMGHVVGEILYKQQGAKGIQVCTQDFRNACSHTIVVGLFSEKGTGALPIINKACREAPGGKGAYFMCFHGLGHGVLSYVGYDLPKAVKLCSLTGAKPNNQREFSECVGGTIMEIISGGDHDKALWSVQSKKYLTTDDPLYPCDADFMPREVRTLCYIYLTPHLFQYAGADLNNPDPKFFSKAFSYCDRLIDELDKGNREVCYGGFGKEFVVLSKDRDIRDVVSITDAQLGRVVSWCSLAEDKDGIGDCIINAVGSLYWGGENAPDAAMRLCGMVTSSEQQNKCYQYLIQIVHYYKDDTVYIRDFCNKIPKQYASICSKS